MGIIVSDFFDKDYEFELENNQYDQEFFKEDLWNWVVIYLVLNFIICDLFCILRK